MFHFMTGGNTPFCSRGTWKGVSSFIHSQELVGLPLFVSSTRIACDLCADQDLAFGFAWIRFKIQTEGLKIHILAKSLKRLLWQ